MALSKELLDVLACPQCKGALDYNELGKRLVCAKCRLSYEIKEGIPVMLVDQATAV